MLDALDRLHARARRSPFLARFTAATRLLLAVGFIPPGMKKVMGERFTALPVEHPVGFFFEAFYQAHGWYVLVGWAQVVAALLLLVPRTAHLGALLFAPIIVNIVAVTWSIGFVGTDYVTALMLLAVVYLLCWDYDRLKALLPRRLGPGRHLAARRMLAEAALFGVAGAAAAVPAVAIRLMNLTWADFPLVAAVLFGLGAAFGVAVALHLRAMPDPQVGAYRGPAGSS